MILLVDVGNSRIKWATCMGGALAPGIGFVRQGSAVEPALASAWEALPAPERVVVASVAGAALRRSLTAWAEDHWGRTPEFPGVGRSALGVTNGYEDVGQMGIDRWVALVAAWVHCRGAVCVVDCGTAITVDVVAGDGRHLGGLIAPGLALMRGALATRTAQLPEVGAATGIILGTNTETCIGTGCLAAAVGLLGTMQTYLDRHVGGTIRWIITGGDAQILLENSSIPFEHLPDLVLRGLALLAERAR